MSPGDAGCPQIAAALRPLALQSCGIPRAAAIESGIVRQAVFASSAAAFARLSFAGSGRRKMPGAVGAIPRLKGVLVPEEFESTTETFPGGGSSRGTSRLICPAEATTSNSGALEPLNATPPRPGSDADGKMLKLSLSATSLP